MRRTPHCHYNTLPYYSEKSGVIKFALDHFLAIRVSLTYLVYALLHGKAWKLTPEEAIELKQVA